jgi:hypothetical protein
VLSGAILGVGGLVFSYFNGGKERAHARQLAEGQHEHEVRMWRSQRHYEDCRETYLDLLRALLIVRERVALTEPIITWEGMPEPPEPPPDDEWRDLRARVIALAAESVNEATNDLGDKVRDFHSSVIGYRITRDDPGGDLEAASTRMLAAREEVNTAFEELQTLVRQELAAL